MTKFYVIGTYSDGASSILGDYDTLKDAQRAIHWQGQPRGELNWHDKAKTRGETWYSGGGWPNEKTQWTICEPSNLRGVFLPVGGGEPIHTSRGAYTVEAYERITREAVAAYVSE
jgi:hypothetical protein